MSELSLTAFIGNWQHYAGTERAGAQSHFTQLCQVLRQETPSTDPTDLDYAFEKVVTKSTGATGFADVWRKARFAWEYKAPGGNLQEAYDQLLRYKDGLDNPRLLVVSDFRRFKIHTNFNDTPSRVYAFNLAELNDQEPKPGDPLKPLDLLRAVFEDPERLKPDRTTAQVTEDAAADFAKLSESLKRYGVPPDKAAHFLVRLLFCMFAQDVRLLPGNLFTDLVRKTRSTAPAFTRQLRQLFQAMAVGDYFGADRVPYFDGTLFENSEAFDLASDDMDVLDRACHRDWASVEPAIFGTLFEQSLKYAKEKRAQLGAHYTSKKDILEVVEPVLMDPLLREWDEVKATVEGIVACRDAAPKAEQGTLQRGAEQLLTGFSARLASVRVLDPACGSGNFLYVALKRLLDLEKQAIVLAASYGLETWHPRVSPGQLHGLEIDPYAHELAQAVIWIGYLQWMRDNGFPLDTEPVLQPLDTVIQTDAILMYDSNDRPTEPEWPEADVIVGNPPFLGTKLLRHRLGDKYVEDLFTVFDGRVARNADLVCYWFEKARALIATGKVNRAGLIATQGIRGGENRRVLEQIKETGDIFWAQSDREWYQEDVAVHVSMVGFDDGAEQERRLDGLPVEEINPNLTGALNLTAAQRLRENANLAYMGDTKGGPFDISCDVALKMLRSTTNPNHRPNNDVVKPWVNGLDVSGRRRGMYIIDFGVDMPEQEAAKYEMPFEHVVRKVKDHRLENNRAAYRDRWWIHVEPRPALRTAIAPLSRYIVTTRHAKHRVFVFVEPATLPDSALIVFAREDDYFFGVLHSRLHELWARCTGTQLREAESGFRYTPTSTFEPFPFPWPPGKEPLGDPRVEAIAQAARELVQLRDGALNPPGASEAEMKKLTLTDLYNRRPTWLANAHCKLDDAVLDAYGWGHDLSDEQILGALLNLNLARALADGAAATRHESSETASDPDKIAF